MSPSKARHLAGSFKRISRLAGSLRWIKRLDLKQRAILGGGGVALVGLGVGLAVALSGGSGPPQHHHAAQRPRTVASSTTLPPPKPKKKPTCPLRGTPAPHSKVPMRPAIGVKIGNDYYSRPQSGLLTADIVYDEMAEGGITRYLAVFQCFDAPVLGPTRSVRWDDWHILKSFGHPILAFSGGIDQWDQAVAAQTWLFDANGSVMPTAGAYYRTSDRVPPWNYYTSTRALWALDPHHQPPPPQFTYSAEPPAQARPASSVTIANFDTSLYGVSPLQWRWSKARNAWLRFNGGQRDVDAGGQQLSATNVVVQMVQTQPGPYAESGTTPDTESITQGSGVAYVLRDGLVEKGSWSCARYGDVTRFIFPGGATMTLAPGNTWVELVPVSGYPVSISR